MVTQSQCTVAMAPYVHRVNYGAGAAALTITADSSCQYMGRGTLRLTNAELVLSKPALRLKAPHALVSLEQGVAAFPATAESHSMVVDWKRGVVRSPSGTYLALPSLQGDEGS